MELTAHRRRRIKRPMFRPNMVYWPNQMAQRYGFGTLAAPSGGNIVIIELGGGIASADLQAACAAVHCPVPKTQEISVDGASGNYTGDPNSADGECALDVQVCALSTLGQVGLIVVWAPNSDTGPGHALQWCADNYKKYNIVSVSMSWGGQEQTWSAQGRQLWDAAAQELDANGVPVLPASGDGGSADGESTGNITDFPACSPWCIACGGTTIAGGVESAWSFGGGGLSKIYATPSYQKSIALCTMRGSPDIAASADPNSGYQIMLKGTNYVFGGTSAVAPLYAGMFAILAAKRGKLFPNAHDALYANLALFTDIVTGNNGGFQTQPGYDFCTGCGATNDKTVEALLNWGGVTPPPPPPPPPPPSGRIYSLRYPVAVHKGDLIRTPEFHAARDWPAGKYAVVPDVAAHGEEPDEIVGQAIQSITPEITP